MKLFVECSPSRLLAEMMESFHSDQENSMFFTFPPPFSGSHVICKFCLLKTTRCLCWLRPTSFEPIILTTRMLSPPSTLSGILSRCGADLLRPRHVIQMTVGHDHCCNVQQQSLVVWCSFHSGSLYHWPLLLPPVLWRQGPEVEISLHMGNLLSSIAPTQLSLACCCRCFLVVTDASFFFFPHTST